MPNKDGSWDEGEGKRFEDESTEKEQPRYAGRKHTFDEDTDEAIVLPKVKPELTEDDGAGSETKKADAAFDDLEIEIDEDDLKAESESQPVGRKY